MAQTEKSPADPPFGPLTIWAVSGGARGMENQALGLAERLHAALAEHELASPAPAIVVKRAALKSGFGWTPYGAFGLAPDLAAHALERSAGPLEAPWPDLIIGCGRIGVGAALAVKHWSRGESFCAVTQDPNIPARRFDLVIPPQHDRLEGPNVVPILGAPNRLTEARLAQAQDDFAASLGALPKPLVSVLIGGNTKRQSLTQARIETLARQLADLAAQGCGLAVSTSRRTGAQATHHLQQALAPLGAYLWTPDSPEENPYFGMLAHADHLIVSEDSVNMVTEAAATGRPVHIFPLEGTSPKLTRFHDAMRTRGITRPFDGQLETWSYVPLDETARAARALAAALIRHRAQRAAGSARRSDA